MNDRRSIRESIQLPVLVTLCVTSSLAACATTERDPLSQPAVTARLSVADGTVHYRNLDADELEAWGPSALRMAPDESFWIVDAAGDQLVHLAASGRLVARLPLAEHVTGAMDVLVREHDLFVLDTGANTPRVVRLDREGRFLGELKLSAELESSVDGFFDTHDGRVLLQIDGVEGCEVQVHDEQLSACARPEPLTVAGHAISVSTPDALSDQSLRAVHAPRWG